MALNKKGVLCTVGAMSMLFTGTVGVSAYQGIREEILLEKAKAEKEKELIAKEKAREEALALKYTGTKREFIDYAYDAQVVSEMLMSKKYNTDEKMVFFTFDNITSSDVADTITQMFNEFNAKGTFFYSGKQLENIKSTAGPVVEKLYNEGNSIGNRSYSDSYKTLFPGGKINTENFMEEYAKTDKVLQDMLGESFKTRAYRCPGGSMSWRGVNDFSKENSEKESFAIIDWNVAPQASSSKDGTSIAESAIKSSEGKDVVVLLVPKLNEEKMGEFLQKTLTWYDANGYTFKSLG